MTTIFNTSACARTLHVVDIENLLKGTRGSNQLVRAVLDRYVHLSTWADGDLMTIAANPRLGLQVRSVAPVACSVRTRRGKDGADQALLDTMPVEFVVERASRLVIGSGDGIFVEYAATAIEAGLEVLVIGNPGGISRGFRDHGATIIEFDGLGPFAA